MSQSKASDHPLLIRHRLHLGLYERLAKHFNVTPSYISLIAAGKRPNDKVMKAILSELRRIDNIAEAR